MRSSLEDWSIRTEQQSRYTANSLELLGTLHSAIIGYNNTLGERARIQRETVSGGVVFDRATALLSCSLSIISRTVSTAIEIGHFHLDVVSTMGIIFNSISMA